MYPPKPVPHKPNTPPWWLATSLLVVVAAALSWLVAVLNNKPPMPAVIFASLFALTLAAVPNLLARLSPVRKE